MSVEQALVWSIAGSDSGAGAGLQADIKTAQSLGATMLSVVTAVTAQNSQAVFACQPTDDRVLQAQLDALNADMPAKVIKIGMLASQSQVQLVADFIRQLKQQREVFVICDPVLKASTGQQLAVEDLVQKLILHLLPVVDLLTPNLHELAGLSNRPVAEPKQVQQAAEILLATGCNAVLVKGGHAADANYCADSYFSHDQIGQTHSHQFKVVSKRIQTPHSHGSGCCLSSAIASCLALGYPLEDCLILAKAYINQGLDLARSIGQGPGPVSHHGWPTKAEYFPRIERLGGEQMAGLQFAACPNYLGLYPVVDSLEWIEKLLRAGVKTLQLRIKQQQDSQVEAHIQKAISLARNYGARLFINDYWQLAIKHQAYGVHLGQEDMQTADLQAIADAGLRLGLSTHGYYELQRAKQLNPSYIALGHIFPTQTKDMPSRPQGLDNLAAYVALCPDTPTVAIGGINIDRAKKVAKTGVGSIAVVTAITQAADWQQSVQRLSDICELALPNTQVLYYD